MSKFIRQYIALAEFGDVIQCLDTFGLDIKNINKYMIYSLRNSPDIIMRNMIVIGCDIHVREPLHENGMKSHVIFTKGKREYLCFTGSNQICKYSYDYIKVNKDLFIDLKFAGSGITSYNAQIPVMTDIEIKSIKIKSFNTKAKVIGAPQLNLYIEPVSNKVILDGYKRVNYDEYYNLFNEPLVTKLFIPDFVDKIKDSAFVNKNIEQIYIGDGVVTIPYNCFANIKSLKAVKFGNNVKHIKEYAFGNNRSLQVLENMDSITVIGESAFTYCGLESFKAGRGLMAIDKNAFKESALREALLGNSSVTRIGQYAFLTKNFNHLELSKCMKTFYTSSIPQHMKASQIDINSRVEIVADNYSDERNLLIAELKEKMYNY